MATGEERLQVLRMVAAGKLTPEQAEKLLTTMAQGTPADTGQGRESAQAHRAGPGLESDWSTKVKSVGTRRFLRIKVEDEGDTRVNVNIPLDLARLAIQFLPKDVRHQLEDVDIDELLEAARMGAEGKLVEVQDEDSHVEIWID